MQIRREKSPALSGVGIRLQSAIAEIDAAVDPAFRKLMQEADRQGLKVLNAFNMTLKYDEAAGQVDMIPGLILDSKPHISDDFVEVLKDPTDCLVLDYIGDYTGLYDAYAAIMAHAKKLNLALGETAWEVYMNNPQEVDNPNDYHTRIFMPLA